MGDLLFIIMLNLSLFQFGEKWNNDNYEVAFQIIFPDHTVKSHIIPGEHPSWGCGETIQVCSVSQLAPEGKVQKFQDHSVR